MLVTDLQKRLTRILWSPNDGDTGGGGGTGAADSGGSDSDSNDSAGGDTGNTNPEDQQGQAPTFEQLVEQHKTAKETAEKLAADIEAARVAKLTPEEKAAEEKAKAESEAQAAQDKAPETYTDFSVPDGMQLDKETLEKAGPLFKKLNLSQSKAQEVVDLYAKDILPVIQERQAKVWQDTVKQWGEDAKKDPEIGGDKFDKNLSDAQRVVNTFGTAKLKETFDQLGIGNHPEVIRFCAKIAGKLSEDSFETGGKDKQKGWDPQSVYPYMNP